MSTSERSNSETGLLIWVLTVVLVGAASLLVVPSLEAQDGDLRWLPWVGCWESVGADEDSGLLCFTAAGEGLGLTQWVDGEAASTETLAADGVQRPVAMEGCEGWESVEFSEDGRRAFTTTEFTCGDAAPRSGTGVMAFTAPNMWADVRALEVDGEMVAWVQEYRLVGVGRLAEEGIDDPAAGRGMAVRSARMAAAAAIDFGDVVEASVRMDDKAVETWIVVQGDELEPSADDLIRLADAGASDAVIDAVVAVSHPDRFVVEATGPIQEVEVDRPRYRSYYRGYMAYDPFWGPRWGSRYGYNPYGYYGYGYGYDPYWGYPYGGSYGYGYYGGRGGVIVIDRVDNGGRVYNGRGYSRGNSGNGGRTAQPRSGGGQSGAAIGGSGSSRPSAPSRRAVPRRRSGGGSSSISRAPTVRRPAQARPRMSRPAASRPVMSRPAARSRPASSGRATSSRPRGSSRPSRPARRRPNG